VERLNAGIARLFADEEEKLEASVEDRRPAGIGRSSRQPGSTAGSEQVEINRSLASAFQQVTTMLVLVFILSSLAAAQTQGGATQLNVAVAVVPPFVMQQNGSLTGFNIDLWNAIATRMGVKTNYETMPDVESTLDAIRSKRVDIVAAPTIVTAARDEELDFSLPIM
jgi:ABC-type amino acid transport substrate-binding protein